MQNMSQSGASRIEDWGCFIFFLIGSLELKYKMAYNNMKLELMELIKVKILHFSFICPCQLFARL